eukprot:1028758-Pyramimonas_sp.AAC.1
MRYAQTRIRCAGQAFKYGCHEAASRRNHDEEQWRESIRSRASFVKCDQPLSLRACSRVGRACVNAGSGGSLLEEGKSWSSVDAKLASEPRR